MSFSTSEIWNLGGNALHLFPLTPNTCYPVLAVPLLPCLCQLHQLLSCSSFDSYDHRPNMPVLASWQFSLPPASIPRARQPHLAQRHWPKVPPLLRARAPCHPLPEAKSSQAFESLLTLAPASPAHTHPCPLHPHPSRPTGLCAPCSFKLRWPLFLVLPTASTSLKVHSNHHFLL